MNIVVTGIGMVSGIGRNVGEAVESIAAGRSGMGDISLFPSFHRGKTLVSEVKASYRELQAELGLPALSVYSRTALLGMLAARQAVDDAGLHRRKPLRTGFISGTSVGGMDLSEGFYQDYLADKRKGRLRQIVSHDCGDSTEKIAAFIGVRDYVNTVSTACSSAANAILLGARLIRNGYLDRVIAGGTDALCKFTLNGFASLKIIDDRHCRPLDASRSGLNLGEGAAYLVLEKAGSDAPRAYASLSGYANVCEAFHQTASSPEGEGPFQAMRQALASAGLQADDIDYINFHGTATPNNDLAEGNAVKRLFTGKMPLFSSTKAFTGHTLGAAGGIEAVLSVWSVAEGAVYPNLNFSTPIPEHGLVPVTRFQTGLRIRHALSNSFGFGGNDSTLVFSSL